MGLKGKPITCFGTFSAGILELQNVSVFVDGFLGPQLWSPYCTIERAIYFIAGRRPSRNILSQSLLVSSIRWPICIKESKYCLSISSTVNFFFFSLLCYMLMAAPFLLHLPSISWSWLILFSPSNCSALPIWVCPGSVNETSLEVDVSGTFPLVVLRCK